MCVCVHVCVYVCVSLCTYGCVCVSLCTCVCVKCIFASASVLYVCVLIIIMTSYQTFSCLCQHFTIMHASGFAQHEKTGFVYTKYRSSCYIAYLLYCCIYGVTVCSDHSNYLETLKFNNVGKFYAYGLRTSPIPHARSCTYIQYYQW